MSYTNIKYFRSEVQDKILSLPENMQKAVLAKVETIFNKNDNLDDKVGYLNNEEYKNASSDIESLIANKKEELNQLRSKAQSSQEMGLLRSPDETIEDGSQFTALIQERKQLDQRWDELDKLIEERTQKLNLYSRENRDKEITDKKLIKLYDERHAIWDRKDAIDKEIETAIAEYPMGTKFQCGDFVIQRKRAYTDVNGDKNLVFLEY